MSFVNCDGKAFVAFIDICGFKNILRNNVKNAEQALSKFFQIGYDVLYTKNNNDLDRHDIQGLFISDCAVLVVSFYSNKEIDICIQVEKLKILLDKIIQINQKMLEAGFMLTTSIAYGVLNTKTE